MALWKSREQKLTEAQEDYIGVVEDIKENLSNEDNTNTVLSIGGHVRGQEKQFIGQKTDAQSEPRKAVPANIFLLNAYEKIEIVGRGIDLLTDALSTVQFEIGEKTGRRAAHIDSPGERKLEKGELETLLNIRPNMFQDRQQVLNKIWMDFLINGMMTLAFDKENKEIYRLVSRKVEFDINTKKTGHPIKKIYYDGERIEFKPSEVIIVMDNSARSQYIGTPRLLSSWKSIEAINKMNDFQTHFFKNGTVPALALESEDILSSEFKKRFLRNWVKMFNLAKNGKIPVIVDGKMKAKPLGSTKMSDLDFSEALRDKEKNVLTALGIPDILIRTGNNANVAPNLKLFYLMTVLPILEKFTSALSYFFGYKIRVRTTDILSLQPELREQANWLQSLTNTGIITPNEGRDRLGMERAKEGHMNEYRIPRNVAGSAEDANQGGRPEEDNGEDGT